MRFASRGIGADHKRPLSETVEDRLAALDIGRCAGGDDEQLARLGGIRISEHRRSDVALPVPRMLARQQRGGRRADRAHRQMDRAGHQTRGQTVETIVAATEHDFAHGIVVRQHADDDLAVEQVADIRCGAETERLKLADLIRAADIGDHPSSGGGEVCGHRRSHVTKADKADFAHGRRATGQFSAGWTLVGRTSGCICEGKRGTGLVPGHWDSCPRVTASSDAQMRRTHPVLATGNTTPVNCGID